MAELVHITHDSDDFSEWDSKIGSGIATSAGAALGGSAFGVEATPALSASFATWSADPGVALDALRFAARFDRNTLALSAGTTALIMALTWNDLLKIYLKEDSGFYKIHIESEEDDTSVQSATSTATVPAVEVTIEARILRASSDVASDGAAYVYVNNTEYVSLTGLDNYDNYNNWDLGNFAIYNLVSGGSPSGTWYIDEFFVRDDDTQIFSDTFRVLGLAADIDRLYVTGLKNGVFQLYRYLLDTLAEDATIPEFGSATDAEIDSLDRGLLPAVKPGVDGWPFLFGRDGNDIQVQLSDDGGDNFSDISDGGWASTKMAIALLPAPLRSDDLIAAFADNDIYRSSVIGTPTWVKLGDAPVTLRRAARHPTAGAELLLAGQAAGEVEYTHNYGVSFEDVSPAVPDEFDGQTEAHADDGYVDSGGAYNNTGAQVLIANLSQNFSIWVRFPSVAIPPGVAITTAYVTFTPDSDYPTGTVTVDISAEDVDDAVAPTDATDFNGKTRTTASETWVVGALTSGTPVNTPDLSAVIQEIVDRGGWASSNAMQFLIDYVSAGEGILRRFQAYNHADRPKLHVEYTYGAGIINAIEVSL